jgi:hypothetical protein
MEQMNYFSAMFKGRMLYYNLINIAVILTIPISTLLRLEWYGIVMLIFLEIIGMNYLLLRKDKRLIEKHQDETYLDSRTIITKDFREDLIYNVQGYDPLNLFDENANPIEETDHYMACEIIILSEEQEKIKRRADRLAQMEIDPEKKKRIQAAYQKNEARIQELIKRNKEEAKTVKDRGTHSSTENQNTSTEEKSNDSKK